MAQRPLSQDELKTVYEAVRSAGWNVQRAAQVSGINHSTFESRWRRTKGWALSQNLPIGSPQHQVVEVSPDGPEPSSLFDQRWETFTKWIGRSKPSARPKKAIKHNGRRVILHTGDWHIPYMHQQAFLATLEANGDADVCVVGGDSLNCSAFSRFIEAGHVNPRDEFAQLTLALQAVAERYPEVYVNVGNHPDRLRKYFGKRLDSWAMFLVQTNPIQFIVDGLRREHGVEHIQVAKPAIRDHENSNWLTLIGDCAFTHAETHGKLHLRPAENTARWLRKWDRHLSVRPRVVVQEHNHRAGMSYDDELQCLLIQAPCLSEDVAYQTGGDLKYSPNQRGYVRVVQVDGVTQINESRFYLLDDSGASRAA
jgi:hypothetical protein